MGGGEAQLNVQRHPERDETMVIDIDWAKKLSQFAAAGRPRQLSVTSAATSLTLAERVHRWTDWWMARYGQMLAW